MKAGFDSAFFKILVVRQIRQDYLENITGFAWLILQPLLLLAVYAFVFTNIFKARIPDAEGISFVSYLAVAFWPWTAFSEAILRGNGSIVSHSALIGKVSFSSEQIPVASVTAIFLMHMLGYLAVLLILTLTGTDIHWLGVVFAIPILILLWLFACALTLFAAALQVFIKDVAQLLPPLMTFWFFMTPILYSPSILPENLQAIMLWNPMTWFMESLRELLLFGSFELSMSTLIPFVLIPLLLACALVYFRRFSGHFEDFL